MYNREHPFSSPLKERVHLNPGSQKKTYHLVFDLSGSGMTYEVGDTVALFPQNNDQEVDAILKILHLSGNEKVADRKGNLHSSKDFFQTQVSLGGINRQIVKSFLDEKKNPQLEALLSDREALNGYSLLEFLEVFGPTSSMDGFCTQLSPLLPRFYSIASSQKFVGQELHLTIAHVSYTIDGKVRQGVCSDFLCHRAKLGDTVPLYIQSHQGKFGLPPDSVPIIMIGPGTGVAPFRGFLQERGCQTKNWLFFGERSKATDFLYEKDWLAWGKEGKLRIETAFSRDQDEKVYVQHRLQEQGKEVWEWIHQGAYVYVCGDAKAMAKDVEKALIEVIMQEGRESEVGARDYIKKMRQEKRYLRDVY